MKLEPLFNHRKRRVNRSGIPPFELAISMFILCSLILMVYWILAQRNNYNPEDRDLPDAFLDTGIITAKLYHPPLQRLGETTNQNTPARPNMGLLSTNILSDSWQISKQLKEFNPDTLFEKINGEADKFLQQGFKNLQFIRIENASKSDEIGIELYDQGELKGSLGVFAEYVSADTRIMQHDDVVYILNSAGGIGRKGRYFIRLIGNKESPIITAKAEEIMKSLVSLPQIASDIPFEYQLLANKLKINPAFISFQSKNVFQFDFARNFWFGSLDSSQSARVFIHLDDAKNGDTKLFARLVEEQKYDYQILKNSSSFAVMQHLYLKTWFVIRQEGPVIFGVEKMKDVNKARQLIRQTSEILANESEIQQW